MYKDVTIPTSNLVNPSEIEIKDILFDTGASHNLVDKHRTEWEDHIWPVEAEVTLGDNTTRIIITKEIELDMLFYYDFHSDVAQTRV